MCLKNLDPVTERELRHEIEQFLSVNSKELVEKETATVLAVAEKLREECAERRAFSRLKDTALLSRIRGARALLEKRSAVQRRPRMTPLEELPPLPSRTEDLRALVGEVSRLRVEMAEAIEALDRADELKSQLVRKGLMARDLEVLVNEASRVWAIRPDGTRKDPDVVQRHYQTISGLKWSEVSDEIVVGHNWLAEGRRGEPLKISSGVIWHPKEMTRAQLAAIEEIECELGIPRLLSGGLIAEQSAILSEFRKVLAGSRYSMAPTEPGIEDLGFPRISREDGVCVVPPGGNEGALVKRREPFDFVCCGKSAQRTKAIPMGGGVMEFLVFPSGGSWELRVRWRRLKEGEVISQASPAPPAELPRLRVKQEKPGMTVVVLGKKNK
jgi:hypothetical protein